jgi:hypothetical protein
MAYRWVYIAFSFVFDVEYLGTWGLEYVHITR